MSFFDSLDRTELKKMLAVRVADGSLLRRIGKCLHVGVLDGEALLEPELGTAQGSVLSPLLGNVYLHYVLDLWFETEVKPRLRGKATLIRYCDDFLIGFEREDDARRVLTVLEKRLGRFGLTLHPDKTRLLPFGRPPQGQQTWDRSGHLRLFGLHVLLGAVPEGSMGDVLPDKAGEPQTGQAGPLQLVSSPSAPTGQGTARRAQSTRARPLQLLRRQRQLSQSAAARRSHEAGVVQMAVPSQPAHALDVGEVWRRAPAVPSPPPTDDGPHLGRLATSHINGRAGWWKSPCPDLARGRGGKPPGLLYKGISAGPRERALRSTSAPPACDTPPGLCTHALSAGRLPSAGTPEPGLERRGAVLLVLWLDTRCRMGRI